MRRRHGRHHDAFSRYAREREAKTPAMMEAMVNEAALRLQTLVRSFTPESGEPTDHGGPTLKASIDRTPAVREADGDYSATVGSAHHAVMPIEYGSSPHLIAATRAKALKLHDGRFADKVWHPGHRGFHMFQKGAAAMEGTHLGDIADKHITEYLE